MICLDDDVAMTYLAESSENLAAMEVDLLAMERVGATFLEEPMNRVFRAAHTIRGGSSFFDLATIGELAHKMEDVLTLLLRRKIAPTPDQVRVLLRVTDELARLIRSVRTSNEQSVTEFVAALDGISANQGPEPDQPREGRRLRILLVEDDFASRLLLQTFLSRHGECHVAVNGREAVEACRTSLERGRRYDLICMGYHDARNGRVMRRCPAGAGARRRT